MPKRLTESCIDEGIDRKQLKTIRNRFLSIHQERLQRILGELKGSQQNCLVLLPLLFHINHPMLPGFVSTTTPAGIANYSPSYRLQRSARKLSRSFVYKKRARRRYRIQGLYLIGSTGTVAHTAGSDFDVWLCHDPALNGKNKAALQEKATRIENWAEECGLEMHIFVMDADSFRAGNRADLSPDSSGSTQQGLLLEEFYRTGIFLAGRYPLWWLVPPQQEHNYAECANTLLTRRFVDSREYLDFGGLEQIPAKEFFGAGLWQLYKGIDAPYKSVLKILLMESYAHDFPAPHWLSQQTKSAIYDGTTDLNGLDPYVLMFRQVERYLRQQGETKRLELARRCLYFKVGEKLSHSQPQARPSWRRQHIQTLAEEWRWTPGDLVHLDPRPVWKMDRVMEEQNILVKDLAHSYRTLSRFARQHARCDHIDPLELNLLGRKLYTALERRPGKVESINPGISKDLLEPYLSLHHKPDSDSRHRWSLFRGQVDVQQAQEQTSLKHSFTLTEILAWCHINRISSQSTVFALYPESCPVSSRELRAILTRLDAHCGQQPLKPAPSDLSNAATAISSLLFVNVGADPMQRLALEGKQLTSDRSDPLSFGATHSNLVVNLEQLISTSWGERLVHSYLGLEGLLDAVCDYLDMTVSDTGCCRAPATEAHGFSSIRAERIAQRVTELFNDTGQAFGPTGAGREARYALQAEDSWFLIQKGITAFNWIRLDSSEELQELLDEPAAQFRPVVIDRYAEIRNFNGTFQVS